MSEYTNTNVMHHLNNPMRVLIWTVDEISCYSVIFLLGMFTNYVISSFILMYVVGFLLKKFKRSLGATGGFAQYAYWELPQLKSMPKSHVRRFYS